MQYLIGLMLLGMAATGGYGLWQAIKVKTLEAENQRITIVKDIALATVATQETQMEVQVAQVQAFQEKVAQMDAERAEARKQVEYTRSLFNDHDFAKLMAAKPGLITTRMQGASDKVLSDLESATQ